MKSDVCYAQGSCYSGFQYSYCGGGTWYDPDTDSSRCVASCDRTTGDAGIGYNLGGDISQCCGDDSNEYKLTRVCNSWCASAGGDDACCNADNKCVYNSDCYSSGSCYSDDAYCNGGTWYDSDAGQSYCDTCEGTGKWNIGGEIAGAVCCGDDANENKRTRVAGTDSTYTSSSSDDACCNVNNKCVYSSTCYASGSTRGSIPSKNYCNAGTWQGGDAGSTQCTAVVGSGYWNLGGEISSTTCCGDDSSEYKRTCQDGGAGACAESTDDDACCSDNNDCVYNNACYSNMEITPNGAWICNMGTWEAVGIMVVVIATPSTVTTVWQNTDATASINCSTPSPFLDCDPTSYRLLTYASDPGACSTVYGDYSPPGTRTISSHRWVCGAARDTLGTEGFSDSVEFRVDKTNPTASLNPLPAWTNETSVIVGWSGSDTGGSGIDYFELQYKITWTDLRLIQDWTDWTTSVSNPGSLPFSGMETNRTYYFRARARDNAGNIGDWSADESISVDLTVPTCDVGDLPEYTTSSSFVVTWLGSDGESGIQYYDIQSRADSAGCGMPATWGYLNDPDGYHTTETSDDVNGADGCTYLFRCRATDLAGNEGAWSTVKQTTVDATPPVSSVDALPEWTNSTSFTVSWTGSDTTSGIDCYDIQWTDDSVWNDWFNCTTITSDTFGPGSPANVTENLTYSFRSRARDNAGNQETWPPQEDTYTTIDLTPPGYSLTAVDQDGDPITGQVLAASVDNVTITSTATDSISGVEHNYIEYTIVTVEGGETSGFQDCGSASPYGGISVCNITVDFEEGMMIDFWVRVIDRAGNINMSGMFHIGTHPLANFVKHSLYLSLGTSASPKIKVRNIQDQPDNITVTLTSDLLVTPYFRWELLIDEIEKGNIELRDDNQTIVVYNLNPNEERVFYAMVWSSDEARSYYMNLDAFSALNLTDSDSAVVQIGYPASFPGLNEWAILLLIILAVFAYVGLGKEFK